jgi:hypothetical protein
VPASVDLKRQGKLTDEAVRWFIRASQYIL